MTTRISGLDEEEERGVGVSPLGQDTRVHVNDLSAEERRLLLNTSAVGQGALGDLKMPFVALEAVRLAAQKDRQITGELNLHIQRAKELQGTITLLLDLQAALPPEGGTLSPKAKSLMDDLRKRGIEFPNEGAENLTKEGVARLKVQCESKVTSLRTEIQTLITTQIQPGISNQSTIMEAFKNIVSSHARLMATIAHNSVK